MRTPLARIRFALAVIANSDDEELKKKLDAMNDDVQEIDDLIASMLNYARLDHPDIKMHAGDDQVPDRRGSDREAHRTGTGQGLDGSAPHGTRA
jgi:signal transduction histidine kinase